jgi:hypothetical protein
MECELDLACEPSAEEDGLRECTEDSDCESDCDCESDLVWSDSAKAACMKKWRQWVGLSGPSVTSRTLGLIFLLLTGEVSKRISNVCDSVRFRVGDGRSQIGIA